MTMDELRAAYPGAADAVELHERYMAAVWKAALVRGETPAAVTRMAIELIGDMVTGADWHTSGIPLRPQIEHPDFAKYVAAKLGAM